MSRAKTRSCRSRGWSRRKRTTRTGSPNFRPVNRPRRLSDASASRQPVGATKSRRHEIKNRLRGFGFSGVLTAAVCGCFGAREHALLDQFFAASRLRDLTALRNVSSVVFEPREQGTVLSFAIKSVEEVSSGSKLVRVDAQVRRPDGQIARELLLVTISGRMITGVAVVASTPRS